MAAEQGEGLAGPQPVERAAVVEDEGPLAGPAGAAGAVLPGAAGALGRQAPRPPEAAEGGAADGEALDLAELLGGMAVIEVLVGGLDERPHPLAARDGQRPRRGPAPQAMDQAAHARRSIAGLEAAELPRAEGEGVGALGIGDLTSQGRLDQAGPGGLLPAHRDGLPCLHGRTVLQNS